MTGLHLIGYDLGDQGQDWLERALLVLAAAFEARLAVEARLDEFERHAPLLGHRFRHLP